MPRLFARSAQGGREKVRLPQPDRPGAVFLTEAATSGRRPPDKFSGRARLGRLPALGGLVVGGARLDPARALRGLFFLPERRARLEIVHDELARCERLAP